MKLLVFFVVVLALAVFLGFIPLNFPSNSNHSNSESASVSVPLSVNAKFVEMSIKYSTGLGALLYDCSKASERIYSVHGTNISGLAGERYIFDPQGVLLETWTFNPNLAEIEHIDMAQYACILVSKSK